MALKKTALPLPYTSKIQGKFEPGQCLFVSGFASGSTRFDINLHTGPQVTGATRDDIALQFSVHLNEKCIKLNSLTKNAWGKEEKVKLLFKQGEKFDIRIRAHEDKFEMFTNGKQIGFFEYRLPLTAINHIYIVGELELHRCSWEGRYYSVPLETQLPPHALAPGKSLYVAGVVEKKAHRFAINLKAGPDVALHFNPRLDEKKVVRNSMHGQAWDDVEERDGACPFTKEHAFEIVFQCEADQFKIFVDDNLLCSYKHRVPPANINGLSIDGDVDLQGIHW